MTGELDHKRIFEIRDAILQGETKAFETLVEAYQPFVFHIALGIVKIKEDAEEVTQDVFVRIYTSLESFQGKSRFSTWIYRITHNLALNRLAIIYKSPIKVQNWSENHLEIPDLSKGTWDQFASIERKKMIALALSRLADQENLILSLYYLHEQSIKEIAVIMQINPNYAKVKLHRSRQNLEKMFHEILKEEIKDF